MNHPALNFGVQSWCFRQTKDNPAVADKVKQIGVSSIELCGVHADFADPAGFADVVKTYGDKGVKIVSLGVQDFTGADVEKRWFECAAAAGAQHISAHFRVDSFATAVPKTAALAKELGVKVGIHCHGGYQFGGSPDILDHLMSLGDGQIGLCIDTAWCMQIGPSQGDPVAWVQRYGDRVFGVHYKDFTFGKDAGWRDVVVGTGTLDLPAFVAALEAANFKGMAVLEYEGDAENPVPALTRCVSEMRALTAG